MKLAVLGLFLPSFGKLGFKNTPGSKTTDWNTSAVETLFRLPKLVNRDRVTLQVHTKREILEGYGGIFRRIVSRNWLISH